MPFKLIGASFGSFEVVADIKSDLYVIVQVISLEGKYNYRCGWGQSSLELVLGILDLPYISRCDPVFRV